MKNQTKIVKTNKVLNKKEVTKIAKKHFNRNLPAVRKESTLKSDLKWVRGNAKCGATNVVLAPVQLFVGLMQLGTAIVGTPIVLGKEGYIRTYNAINDRKAKARA